MTCNQFILLCQIYRGTDDQELKIGTYEEDVIYLKEKGLIREVTLYDRRFTIITIPEGIILDTTLIGDDFVNYILKLELNCTE